MDEIIKELQQLGCTIEEVMYAICACSEEFEKLSEIASEKNNEGVSPKQYGMIVTRQPGRPDNAHMHYNYIPVIRRNLPYQRRAF